MPIPNAKDLAMNKRYGETNQDYNVPKWRKKIDVYSQESGLCMMSFYNTDLNEVLVRLRCHYFIDKVAVRVEDDEGYVEHIGGVLS